MKSGIIRQPGVWKPLMQNLQTGGVAFTFTGGIDADLMMQIDFRMMKDVGEVEDDIWLRFNNDSGANYYWGSHSDGDYGGAVDVSAFATSDTKIVLIGYDVSLAAGQIKIYSKIPGTLESLGIWQVQGYFPTGNKHVSVTGGFMFPYEITRADIFMQLGGEFSGEAFLTGLRR